MAEEQISIFNIGQHAEEMNAGMFRQKVERNVFNPRLKDVNDSDAFIIRPVPYIKDVLHSLVGKNYYAFQDAMGSFFFDSKTTFNQPELQKYEFCPVSDLWVLLKNSKDPGINSRVTQLRIQRQTWCYVLICSYPKNQELNGKILPMPIPMEMVRAFEKISNPTETERALGMLPTQPFDIYNGKNFTVQVSGHIQGQTLMRKWTVTPDQQPSPISLPLGPNGAMVQITQLTQEQVANYFTEQQTDDLTELYGYHEPSIDVKRRMKQYLYTVVAGIPQLIERVNTYFPELNTVAVTDQNAQAVGGMPVNNIPTAPTPQPVMHSYGDPMAPGNQIPAQPAPAPQPVQQPAMPVSQPGAQVADMPMAQNGIVSAQAQAQPAPAPQPVQNTAQAQNPVPGLPNGIVLP